jgi:hypothetical protein
MPETDGCEHLIEYLFRVGPGMANGMGYVCLTFCEIDAWARRTKIKLTGWESETLHHMSKAYCAQHSISSKKDAQAPWSAMAERQIESNRDRVSEGTLRAFEQAAKKDTSKKPKARPTRGSRNNTVQR